MEYPTERGPKTFWKCTWWLRVRVFPILCYPGPICCMRTKIWRLSWSFLDTPGDRRSKGRADRETKRRLLRCHFFHLFIFHLWQVARKEMKSVGRSHWWWMKCMGVSPSLYHTLPQERYKERKWKGQEALWGICRNQREVGKGDVITALFGKILCLDNVRKTFKQSERNQQKEDKRRAQIKVKV